MRFPDAARQPKHPCNGRTVQGDPWILVGLLQLTFENGTADVGVSFEGDLVYPYFLFQVDIDLETNVSAAECVGYLCDLNNGVEESFLYEVFPYCGLCVTDHRIGNDLSFDKGKVFFEI